MLSSDRSSAPRLLLTVGQLAVILKRVHEPLDGVVSLADVVALKVTLGVRADLDHGTIAGLHAGAGELLGAQLRPILVSSDHLLHSIDHGSAPGFGVRRFPLI